MRDQSRAHEALSLAEPGEDLDEEELDARALEAVEVGSEPVPEQVRAELELVESFVARLEALDTDSKATALLEALRVLEDEAARGQGTGKLVIFTESLATQDYLRRLLIDTGGVKDDEITLFRGENTSERARAALALWEAEVGASLGPGARPARDIALRLALVHEFRQRSRVLISTEAGAKGLNLQFCETVINYDLPWNPQRIEQRIGRVHRYGQTRDVTVINFLMRDNAAERLTFEILSRKLELFGRVLDASDHVLYEPGRRASGAALAALGDDFAAELRRIYQDARSLEQIEEGLLRVAGELDARKRDVEATQQRTLELIESRFDAAVRQTFRHIAAELPAHLRDLDRDLERLVLGYFESEGIAYRRSEGAAGVDIQVPAEARLPEGYRAGFALHVGGSHALEGGEVLHVAHPLVSLAVEAARAGTSEPFHVRFAPDGVAALCALSGRRGRLRVLKLRYPGFEPVDRLLPIVVLAGSAEVLDRGASWQLLEGSLEALPSAAFDPAGGVSDDELTEAVQEALFIDEREVSSVEHRLFERAIQQLERFIEDRVLVLRRRREELLGRMETLRRERNAAIGPGARDRAEAALERCERELVTLDGQLGRLQSRDDDGYQRWRQRAYERRYAPPACESIVEAEFVIG